MHHIKVANLQGKSISEVKKVGISARREGYERGGIQGASGFG